MFKYLLIGFVQFVRHREVMKTEWTVGCLLELPWQITRREHYNCKTSVFPYVVQYLSCSNVFTAFKFSSVVNSTITLKVVSHRISPTFMRQSRKDFATFVQYPCPSRTCSQSFHESIKHVQILYKNI